jgi:hypothetical protein
MRKCTITNCNNNLVAKGLCSAHRKINKKYGSPTPVCWCGELAQTFAGNRGFSLECKEHTLLSRFWNNVKIKSDNECWEWQGSKTTGGYGVMLWDKETFYTHRLSIEFTGIKIPARYYVCHKCDNPSCVNPNHLFIGSPRDNALDKVSKKRHTYGENHPNAVLTDAEINSIRIMAEDGIFLADIAKIFNVSNSHISKIVGRLVRYNS